MAIDYDGSNTGIFTRIGKFIKYINTRYTEAATGLPAELKEIADQFEAADLTDQITGLYRYYDGMRGSKVRERQRLATFVDNILLDPTTVLKQFTPPLDTSDAQASALALFRQMQLDTETVNKSTVSIGTVTAAGANVGNGTVLITKLLDGVSRPRADWPSNLYYAGINSELACSETMTFTCIRDYSRDGATEGSEVFAWSGGILTEPFTYLAEGSGVGPTVMVSAGRALNSNGDFESWSSNTPSGWTIAAGTAGTHILRESGAGNFHRGSYSCKFHGDGALAAITITQAMRNQMKARKLYCVSLRVKASASTGTGSFECKFTGTGYTASSTEKVSISAGSMPTSPFTASGSLQWFWIVTPATMPADWTLSISNAGTPGASSAVYVDSVHVVEGIYHGGLGVAIVPGSTRFVAGDLFTSAITNDDAGVIQRFFRHAYGVQLPSDSSPSIADSLAT
jgi:hypothetical protein